MSGSHPCASEKPRAESCAARGRSYYAHSRGKERPTQLPGQRVPWPLLLRLLQRLSAAREVDVVGIAGIAAPEAGDGKVKSRTDLVPEAQRAAIAHALKEGRARPDRSRALPRHFERLPNPVRRLRHRLPGLEDLLALLRRRIIEALPVLYRLYDLGISHHAPGWRGDSRSRLSALPLPSGFLDAPDDLGIGDDGGHELVQLNHCAVRHEHVADAT